MSQLAHSMRDFCPRLNASLKKRSISEDLTGKAVSLNYSSGHVLEQHWQKPNTVLWKGIAGSLAGYTQTEYFHTFKIAEEIYLFSRFEEATVASASASQTAGPWLTDVILDFRYMRATASWTAPGENGGVEHVLDQAAMCYVKCDE